MAITLLRSLVACGAILFGMHSLAGAQALATRYDVALLNGLIHVGDGSEPFTGHVAIDDGQIVAIERNQPFRAAIEIDCSGLIICPGFIDLHTHSDRTITVRDTRANINYLLQGCTTVVTGNCGGGRLDVGAYLDEIDEHGAGSHVAHLVPQGTLRGKVLGEVDRRPTADELQRMCEMAAKGMEEGAFGMSTGLIYLPGAFSDTNELIALAEVVAQHDGIYASHIRGEGNDLLESVREAIQIGEEADLPVHISHFKASGKSAWGSLHLASAMIDQARDRGLIVTADQYPYTASSTSLNATVFPTWAREGGRKQLLARLDDSETVERIRKYVQQKLDNTSRLQVASCAKHPEFAGKSIDEIAVEQEKSPVDVAIEIERDGGASIVNFGMNENDMRAAMPADWLATASDGVGLVPTANRPHPRSSGTFPRKIGHYAIAEQTLPLAAAIRSATGLPAQIIGLTDRGLLKPGMAADIAVFDPDTFCDQATFEQPFLPPTGMRYVLVEGAFAVAEGQATGMLAGHALRKTAPVRTTSATQAE